MNLQVVDGSISTATNTLLPSTPPVAAEPQQETVPSAWKNVRHEQQHFVGLGRVRGFSVKGSV